MHFSPAYCTNLMSLMCLSNLKEVPASTNHECDISYLPTKKEKTIGIGVLFGVEGTFRDGENTAFAPVAATVIGNSLETCDDCRSCVLQI